MGTLEENLFNSAALRPDWLARGELNTTYPLFMKVVSGEVIQIDDYKALYQLVNGACIYYQKNKKIHPTIRRR
jgi:hypothetical protein